ncbi:2-dehydropantoate 2-reductase [Cellulomonas sp. JZ18]|uniref:ketopantoate reductase family protein n=1 Tax=Cellulomonas sp. JZ18 TaxID=2654191 RepID=UPI0012D3B528|nr:2-dehydropantoate 2-reductase [Cellulomonas sp. JZ18]QGQ17950.1 2-dehydropantoate 2-reductase [Cellulomonas sp. JZ18]
MDATPPARATVAVLGPGGIGGLVAALVARAGHRVVVLAGDATVDVLRRDGLHLTSAALGDAHVSVEADTELREPADVCVVTVKQGALPDALRRVDADAVRGTVVPLLNGVEHMTALREHFPAETVVAGVIRAESTRVAPGRVVHGSPFADVDLASRTASPDRLEAVRAVLADAGLGVRVRDDEDAVLWGKLAVLAPFALLTTRYAAPIGEVRTRHRDELVALVREVAAVSVASGGPDTTQSALTFYDAFPAGSRSSMQRDAEAGRPLELDAVGGAVVRAARRSGLAVPVTQELVRALS